MTRFSLSEITVAEVQIADQRAIVERHLIRGCTSAAKQRATLSLNGELYCGASVSRLSTSKCLLGSRDGHQPHRQVIGNILPPVTLTHRLCTAAPDLIQLHKAGRASGRSFLESASPRPSIISSRKRGYEESVIHKVKLQQARALPIHFVPLDPSTSAHVQLTNI